MPLYSATATPTDRPRDNAAASTVDRLLRTFADLDAHPPEGEPDPGADRRRPLPLGAQLPLWRAKKIERFIAANLDRTLSLETLASQVQLSCNHFARACKNTLGVTPRQLVLRHRIDHAQVLLRDTATPLGEIALICGFADQAHFSRKFRQEVEATPSDWRRRNRAASN